MPLRQEKQRLAKADGELLDLDADVLGGEEVAQLVKEDHEAETETEEGDAPDLDRIMRGYSSFRV
jgi:hypothetical protein